MTTKSVSEKSVSSFRAGGSKKAPEGGVGGSLGGTHFVTILQYLSGVVKRHPNISKNTIEITKKPIEMRLKSYIYYLTYVYI